MSVSSRWQQCSECHMTAASHIHLHIVEADVMLRCFSLEGDKHLVFNLYFIIIFSWHYIRKFECIRKINMFEHCKTDIKMNLETLSKSKKLKAIRTNYCLRCTMLCVFFSFYVTLTCLAICTLFVQHTWFSLKNKINIKYNNNKQII